MLHGGQRAFVELLPEGDPHHFRVSAADLAAALAREREHFCELVARGIVKVIEPNGQRREPVL
jgi:hypothetical protein